MAPGYDISQIGYSPLGTMGLGSTGAYGSYDYLMPSTYGMGMGMGMDQSIWNMGGYGMNPAFGGGYGMMGYFNPAYMAQLQQQVESSQAQHASNMHSQVLANEVAAYQTTDSALMQKILTNGSVQQGVQNLYAKVMEGDQDGICAEIDKLQQYIYDTYAEEFKASGCKNPAKEATQYIEIIYGNIAEANTGKQSSLRDDILQHGDNAFLNGFKQGFREGHHERYTAETMNHCFGLDIDNKGSQDFRQDVGKVFGTGASVLEKGAYGAVAGAALYTVGGGALSLAGKSFGLLKNMKFNVKALGKWAVLAAAAAAVADIVWKITDTDVAKA